MDIKQAVVVAKNYLIDVLSDEAVELPTLEEVWFEDKKGHWQVTLGVRRKFASDTAAGRLGLSFVPDYKTVTISDKDGRVVSVRDRLLQGLHR